jgi:nitroimidazol reductase NimA-like FMN-containing flavoprotein (pyridoxamine 5'-phosphate oxidase superfamily)
MSDTRSTSESRSPETRPQDALPEASAPGSVLEELDREECLRLIASGGIGRIAFGSVRGPTVLPVNYRLHRDAIVFRTEPAGPVAEALRTGMRDVDVKIAFEIDSVDEARRSGWSVLVRGPAHQVRSDELASVAAAGVEPWAVGDRRLYVRILPLEITGRRLRNL